MSNCHVAIAGIRWGSMPAFSCFDVQVLVRHSHGRLPRWTPPGLQQMGVYIRKEMTQSTTGASRPCECRYLAPVSRFAMGCHSLPWALLNPMHTVRLMEY